MEENVFIKYCDKDYLPTAGDGFFAQGCVPHTDTKDNDLLVTLVEKLPDMKTPKPDLSLLFGGL